MSEVVAVSIADAKAKLDAARKAVVLSEQEMQRLKRKIRELGEEDDKDPNTFEWVLTRIDGLSDDVIPVFTLQLSSPIEEGMITKVFVDKKDEKINEEQPTTGENNEKEEKAVPEKNDGKEEEGSSSVKFSGVEIANATLTVSLKDSSPTSDNDITLGTSESIDIVSLSSIADLSQPQYVTEIPVILLSDKITEESKEDGDKDDAEAEATKDTKKPVCTATFKVTYKPSTKDQREELYDLLNKASEKKTKAIGELNEAAKSVTRANPSTSPAVQKGFLNKSSSSDGSITKYGKNKKENWVMKKWNKYLGPQSFARRSFPVLKNYLIFFGAVTLFHFKGQELALPPPV